MQALAEAASELGSMFSCVQSCLFAERSGLQGFGPAGLSGAKLRSPFCWRWQFHHHHEHPQAPTELSQRGSSGQSGQRKRRIDTEAGTTFPGGQGRLGTSSLPKESHPFFATSKPGVTCSWGNPFFI